MSQQEQQQSRSPEEIRSDIEHTREELADTAAALAHKADVKARAHDRVEEVKADLRERVDHVKSTVKDKAPDSSSGGPGASLSEAASSAQAKARENPVPTAAIAAALLGFALGYLLASRSH